MRRYALRYLPLIILALLLVSFRIWQARVGPSSSSSDSSASELPVAASSFAEGTALYSVSVPSANVAWAVGGTFTLIDDQREHLRRVVPSLGLILRYQNGSWVADASVTVPLLGISMSSSQDGWAVGYAGQMAHYQGQHWSFSKAPTNAILCNLAMLSDQDGWAVGFSGSLLHYQDQQWRSYSSPTTSDLLGISMISSQDGWAVGGNGTILHYSQNHWQMVKSPTTQTLNSVSMISSQEGWAVGRQGTILHYREGSWSQVKAFAADGRPLAPKTLWSVGPTSIRSGWIGGDGMILTYSNEVWQEAPLPFASLHIWYALTMMTPDEGWIVGDIESIYHYQSGQWKSGYTV